MVKPSRPIEAAVMKGIHMTLQVDSHLWPPFPYNNGVVMSTKEGMLEHIAS